MMISLTAMPTQLIGILICSAPYAVEKGINLNLELLNSKVDHPGYQCDHTAWGVAVCATRSPCAIRGESQRSQVRAG